MEIHKIITNTSIRWDIIIQPRTSDGVHVPKYALAASKQKMLPDGITLNGELLESHLDGNIITDNFVLEFAKDMQAAITTLMDKIDNAIKMQNLVNELSKSWDDLLK